MSRCATTPRDNSLYVIKPQCKKYCRSPPCFSEAMELLVCTFLYLLDHDMNIDKSNKVRPMLPRFCRLYIPALKRSLKKAR